MELLNGSILLALELPTQNILHIFLQLLCMMWFLWLESENLQNDDITPEKDRSMSVSDTSPTSTGRRFSCSSPS